MSGRRLEVDVRLGDGRVYTVEIDEFEICPSGRNPLWFAGSASWVARRHDRVEWDESDPVRLVEARIVEH